jgi:hypothetical protein
MSWGNDTPDMDQLTMKKFQELCEHLIKLRDKKDEIEEVLKNGNIEIKACENKILEYMKEFGLPSFKGAFGTISIKNNKSVSQPQTPEDKEAFFDYLREQGIFEDMVSVNSRTLSSWANKEIEAKEKEGVFGWTPPGLRAPTEFQSLSVRKNG